MRVATALERRVKVVDVEHAADPEWDINLALDGRKGAARVDLGIEGEGSGLGQSTHPARPPSTGIGPGGCAKERGPSNLNPAPR
jgi:hypothetical protein